MSNSAKLAAAFDLPRQQPYCANSGLTILHETEAFRSFVPVVFVLLMGLAASSVIAQTTRPTTRPSRGAPALDEIFALLDANHDGVISRDEAVGPWANRFKQWDAKGRGFVTRQDIHDFRASRGIDDNGNRVPAARNAAAGNPVILKEPADWRAETFSFPPPFAPDIKLTGKEEARFAPGMYNTAAADYFTYVVAIRADKPLQLDAAALADLLEKYFRGLSAGRARRTGQAPDLSQMRATVTPVRDASQAGQFNAQMVFFDSFTDGRKITLNIAARVVPQIGSVLLLLISPSSPDSPTWAALRQIGDKAESSGSESGKATSASP